MQVTSQRTVQALTHLLADEYSRKILLSAIPHAKSVEELSIENGIPLSTCYRRVHELFENGILVVERIVIAPDGKKYELYRSGFRGMSVKLEGGSVEVEATVNEDIADKLYNMWSVMKWKDQGT